MNNFWNNFCQVELRLCECFFYYTKDFISNDKRNGLRK